MTPRARVTTRTGDTGDTSLFGRGRVRKTDPRIEALGDLDEAQAALGLARATIRGRDQRLVLELQRALYVMMSEIATPAADLKRLPGRIDGPAVAQLDALVARLRERAKVEGRFVIPGEDPVSATLDLARTIARRAERSTVALLDAGTVRSEHLLPWLNRLSDVLFLFARAVERRRTAARGARSTAAAPTPPPARRADRSPRGNE